ncbi:hypothetical protein PQZ50_01655 [Methylophilaceae bacterium]|nr:hypothetical protein [Methylophilaceae bacterium]
MIAIFISISVQASDRYIYLSCDATSDKTSYLKKYNVSDREIEKLKLMVELQFFPDGSLLSISFQSNNPKVSVITLLNSPEYNPEDYSTDREWFFRNIRQAYGRSFDIRVTINRFTGEIDYSKTIENSEGKSIQSVNGKCNKVDFKKKF